MLLRDTPHRDIVYIHINTYILYASPIIYIISSHFGTSANWYGEAEAEAEQWWEEGEEGEELTFE